MRISDDRYSRERLSPDLALGFLPYQHGCLPASCQGPLRSGCALDGHSGYEPQVGHSCQLRRSNVDSGAARQNIWQDP